jgi:hypothetical protein
MIYQPFTMDFSAEGLIIDPLKRELAEVNSSPDRRTPGPKIRPEHQGTM